MTIEHAGGGGRAGHEVERVLRALGERQQQVANRAQLHAAGLGRGAIAARLLNGRLVLLYRGIYLIDRRRPSPDGLAMAAVLACGPSACLGDLWAAATWGMLDLPRSLRSLPQVLTRGGRKRRRPGIATRAVSLSKDETTTCRRIPITTPARTILDLCAVADRRTAEQAMAVAGRRNLVRRPQLERLADRHAGRPGVPALRALLGGGRPAMTRSEAERRMLALIRRARLPEPETNQPLYEYEIDFLWREARLGVEADGYAWHSARDAFNADRARDARLGSLGWLILRFSWDQLVDEPEVVLTRLAQTLARRS